MIYKIVHYRVKAEQVEPITQAIAAFVTGIQAAEPGTYYAGYQSEEDRQAFVHLMAFPDESAEKYHQTAPHTLKFVDILYPNCEELPVFTGLRRIRSTGSLEKEGV